MAGIQYFPPPSGAGNYVSLAPTALKAAPYVAVANDLAVMNVPGGATSVTLPAAPADKDKVGVVAIGATTAVPLTVNRGGSATIGYSGGTSVTLPLANEVTVYQYDAANTRWLAVDNVKPLAALDGRYLAPAPTGVAATDTASVNTAKAAGLRLQAGTYVINKVTLNTGDVLRGAGRELTVLQLANGVNDNAVESANFATLTSTDTTTSPRSFTIEDLTIDGNKSNQSAGAWHGLALYAFSYRVDNIIIRNCRGRGFWSEWGSASPFLAPDGMESMVTNFKIHDTDAGGISFQGPHDTHFIDGFVVKNSGTISGAYGIDIPIDGRANGSVFTNVHVYGGVMDYCLRNISSGLNFVGCQFEGGVLGETLILSSQNQMSECKWFTSGVAGNTAKAIVVGDATHTGINNLRISGKVENCGGAVLDLTYSGGDHNIDIHAQYFGSGTGSTAPSPAVLGTVDANSTIRVTVINKFGIATSDSVWQWPTDATVKGKLTAAGLQGNLTATNTVSYPLSSNVAPALRAETLLRQQVLNSGISIVAGTPQFAYFTPDATITVSNLSTVKFGTAAAGATAAKMALYSVDGSGNLTCIARTASDATLWSGADGIVTKAIADDGAASPNTISQVTLTRGQRYALGVLIVGATTAPQLARASTGNAAIAFLTPVLATVTTSGGQADFASAYTAGQVAGVGSILYGFVS